MKNLQELLGRGVEEIIDKQHLEERLIKGDKLRVKLGIDPTAKDLHLGHTVVLRKLRQFQDAGHQAVFIMGDFTAMIGDPSGRSELRPTLTGKEIKENMKNYLEEVGKVIDVKKTEVHYNSEWYKDKEAGFLMELASKFTVARMLERDDFQKRLKQNQDIGLLEILYPILQGYDSFAIKSDLELGGTDQKFNLLTGRKVQKRYGQSEQDIITVPLIEGLDGVKKMSKSTGNYIGLSESAENMFGKIMSLPDSLMVKYFTFLTDVSDSELDNLKKDRENPSLAKISPKEWKERLAFEVVLLYHGGNEAKRAQNNFEKVFSERKSPDEIQEVENKENVTQTIVAAGVITSTSEVKRLIDQKAVKVNDKVIEDWGYKLQKGDIVKIGPWKFIKIE